MTERTKERPRVERPSTKVDSKSNRSGQPPRARGDRKTPKLREPVRSEVEPVLVERRKQIELKGREQRIRLFKGIAAALVLTGVVAAALFSPLLDIDRFQISGLATLTPSEIEAGSGLQRGSAMVSADLSAAKAQIESNPWVANASLKRSYPGTVQIAVTEEVPALVLVGSRGRALVSRNGRVLDYVEGTVGQASAKWAAFGGLLEATYEGRIAGDSPSAAPLPGRHVTRNVLELVRLSTNMTPTVRANVEKVELRSSGSLDMILSDSSKVLFGPTEEITAKLMAVEAVLDQVDLECLARIDVRNATRATVTRKANCSSKGSQGQ
ncbi:MAG: FtsQ-type POTRA domain-containing protein [Microthrixaceae bacterium]|nr:FtsQ-type POTRA domain-containing protein [Microthrixaceae bacterium]